jgi:hypothetical protein
MKQKDEIFNMRLLSLINWFVTTSVHVTFPISRMPPTSVRFTDPRTLHLELPYKHGYAVFSESNYVAL